MQQLPKRPTRAPTWSRRVSKRGRYNHVTKAAPFSQGQGVSKHPSESWQCSATGAARPEGEGSTRMEAGQAYFDVKGAASTEGHWTSGEHGATRHPRPFPRMG